MYPFDTGIQTYRHTAILISYSMIFFFVQYFHRIVMCNVFIPKIIDLQKILLKINIEFLLHNSIIFVLYLCPYRLIVLQTETQLTVYQFIIKC